MSCKNCIGGIVYSEDGEMRGTCVKCVPSVPERAAGAVGREGGEVMPRVIAWFSCGDASAVACWLTLKSHPEAIVVRIHIPDEHPDNERFAADCARWYGKPITVIQDAEKRSTFDVWEKRRYIAGIAGAPCTGELKKAVRYEFQRPEDVHVFGFTIEERKRAETFRQNNFELALQFPLIDAGLSKPDCHAIVQAQGIQLPAMYRLGFNNNCIGCPKGGAGYWNMIRRHFPERFARMAELSRRLGARLIKQDGVRVFLDELRTDTGRQKDEVTIECSPLCEPFIPPLPAERGAVVSGPSRGWRAWVMSALIRAIGGHCFRWQCQSHCNGLMCQRLHGHPGRHVDSYGTKWHVRQLAAKPKEQKK